MDSVKRRVFLRHQTMELNSDLLQTFNAARKAHYQSESFFLESINCDQFSNIILLEKRARFIKEDEAYPSEDDLSYLSDDDILEDELGPSDIGQRLGDRRSAPNLASKPVKKQRLNGRRQELVWRAPTDEAIKLNDIARDFQYFLNANGSSLQPALNRRRGRYTARTSHRCPGYNRIEIVLTPDIRRSTIVLHSSPIPYEICPICKEAVKDTEIFNCICGNNSKSE